MSNLAMDVRELSIEEVENVAGGAIPLIAGAIVAGKWLAAGAGAAIVGEFAIGVINGFAEEMSR